jgi:hypothetical protein
MRTWKKLLSIALLMAVLASCHKYPDGPSFSLLTKKARLDNIWRLQQYLVGDVDKTNAYLSGLTDFTFELSKKGAFKRTSTTNAGVYTDEGSWEFSNKKEELIISYTTSNRPADTLVILKLKNKELWLMTKNSSPEEVFHYIPR